MKRITDTQKRRIVSLFQSGTTIQCLAEVWDVEWERIEAIIRHAMARAQREDV